MKAMIKTLKRFFRRIAATAAYCPVETFIILLFYIYAILAIEDAVPSERCYIALYPLFFTAAFLCNTISAGHRGQWRHPLRILYYACAPLPLLFLESDASGFVNSVSYFISLVLCPLSLFASGLRNENRSYVSQSILYIKNAVYAAVLSGMTFVLLYAIYLSFTYIFFPENHEAYHMADMTAYLLLFSFLLFMPFAFLAFTRENRENPVKNRAAHTPDIAGIAINYIMTPALLLYTCMLYIYFASILITWTLPKGGIATMVFIYTMAAMASRAVHMTIRKQHVFAKFYTRFSFISLPALVMFWTGVWYRISEYGFTQARVYLVVCGVIMTATMVLFFSEKYGRFLYANIIAIALFALFTYIPGISAHDIEQRSQAGRTDHTADTVETDTVAIEKRAYLYWYNNESQTEYIPVNIKDYSSLHKIVWSGLDCYRYDTPPATSGAHAESRLIVVSPSDDTLINKSFAEILSVQLEKCGLDARCPADSLQAHRAELLVYDTDSMRTVFYYMCVERLKDSTLCMVDVAPELLLLK